MTKAIRIVLHRISSARISAFAVFSVALLFQCSSLAQTQDYRHWQSTAGKTLYAAFSEISGEDIILTTPDQRSVQISIEYLSASDIPYAFPGGREWISVNQQRLIAKYISESGGNILLEDIRGTRSSISVENLSSGDLEYLASKGVRLANAVLNAREYPPPSRNVDAPSPSAVKLPAAPVKAITSSPLPSPSVAVVQHPIAPQTQLLNSMTAFDPDSIRARMITAKLSGGARIARVGDAPTGSPLESELAKVEREFTQRQFDPVVRQDRSFLPEMDVIKEQAKRGDRNMQIGILMGKATDLINEAQDPESKRQAMEAYVFLSKVQDEYQGMYAENPLEANSFLQKAAYGAAQSARDKQLFLSILAVFIGIVFLILIVYICDEIKNKFFPAVLRTVKHWDSDAQGAHIGGVRMNGLQRIILFISFVFVVGMCAFPPWFEVNHNGVKNAYGYHLIVNPPETYSSHGYEIDLPRLAVQILIVAGAGAAVFVFCAGGSRER